MGTETELERKYDLLAEAVDRVPEDRVPLLLAKLALLLGERVDAAEFARMVESMYADGVRLFVDPVSISYLRGAEVDFVDTITGGGFTIKNPNATSTCGCGSSFSA